MSFPPEARRCLHCGGRLSPPAPSVALEHLRTSSLPDPAGRTAARSAADATEAAEAEVARGGDEAEDARPSGLLRSGLGGIWIVLALAATCYRVCSGSG